MSATSLRDTRVVITGASGRLGAQLMRGFAEHGATIVAIDRDPSRLPPIKAGRSYQADLTNEVSVARAFAQIRDAYKHIDVVLHAVGAWAAMPLLDTSVEAWERMLSVNLTSTFLCFREAARLMAPGGGRLIAISSAQGADRGRARQAAYSASKAGVIRLVEAVAEEFATAGVTAHALAPSYILYGDEGPTQKGVPVGVLVEAALYLSGGAAASFSGDTLRYYGSLHQAAGTTPSRSR